MHQYDFRENNARFLPFRGAAAMERAFTLARHRWLLRPPASKLLLHDYKGEIRCYRWIFRVKLDDRPAGEHFV